MNDDSHHDNGLRVGFCGLGKMGLPMARRLAEAGFRTALWNRSAQKAHALGASLNTSAGKASAFETAAEVAAHSEAVMLCLADHASVEAVAFGAQGLARGAPRGLVVVDHSTMAPAQAQALARRWHDETGGAWIDAPVSGGTAGAAAGTLAIMAGGDAHAIDTTLGAMRAYAARVTRMGASGAGQATKLANQTIVMTTIAGIAEATRLARRTGIQAASMPAALAGGWADSVLLQTLQPRMIAAPAQPSGTIRTMLKDLDAVESYARENGVTLPVAALVRRWLARACEQGLAEADISQIVTVELD
ncbi:NAD(P)-dependent oxidoreductase [Paraburkholderia acidisoli]|uniref:NAD-binding protein n=1 Tax=Paraburkholderia acidisoli TaxID=2571748 RepID=A0A7Z2JH92_9BURK|nr:NAD(P)-dependent oxidoreductase [Paraburkholderia acidisoli]QGZ63174.1 NAD-binding protein [Paraburkholderia acidisoli]